MILTPDRLYIEFTNPNLYIYKSEDLNVYFYAPINTRTLREADKS